ncbi:DUF6429 family protein [Sphingobium sp. V4]|uniref:DUF6429 family protein n=1 Tax=Sphingobium sp. V4 TaxID=3038927 RepID=UPI0025581A44|nr:DUF6429 family protein [Sphingobium sp. V4]WIW89583.1 DUF6429 family protein [Sphingobium sp. V4]
MDFNTKRLDEAVLALLWFNLDTAGTAWKGFDWSAMERLHGRDLITDPVRKSKSVFLTPEGITEGERLFRELFTRHHDEWR